MGVSFSYSDSPKTSSEFADIVTSMGDAFTVYANTIRSNNFQFTDMIEMESIDEFLDGIGVVNALHRKVCKREAVRLISSAAPIAIDQSVKIITASEIYAEAKKRLAPVSQLTNGLQVEIYPDIRRQNIFEGLEMCKLDHDQWTEIFNRSLVAISYHDKRRFVSNGTTCLLYTSPSPRD